MITMPLSGLIPKNFGSGQVLSTSPRPMQQPVASRPVMTSNPVVGQQPPVNQSSMIPKTLASLQMLGAGQPYRHEEY